ncbi:phosphate ABC transporter permease subunit PstC [Orrella daihaiensis]|uniref:Phosphate transport system permease protein n=1 Tax=Orrella daihaiensis TaxID=2782176 RepID=A0ABY4ALD5_9BURK|nr:phosphate ABC transporter permease subunit PstC [Orrella daihaiensis]UOD50858.1 phosphate ABC transporter permease subunit PstC [Orrella daihaiensis]
MNAVIIPAILLILAGFAYQIGLRASVRAASAAPTVSMHSRPSYHGWLAVLRAAVPAVVVYLIWYLFGGGIVDSMVLAQIPAANLPESVLAQDALMQRIFNLSTGFGVAGEAQAWESSAAAHMAMLYGYGRTITFALMATVAALGLFFSWRKTTPATRARNKVEKFITTAMLACSAVAILTTLGIVLSMLGEAIKFFSFVNPLDFFFGTTWNPRFVTVGTEGQAGFGMVPLLAGTMMIALIAMLVATPLGLLTAIFTSEYASDRVRAIVKPLVEVLAGIPTIVYGFFALVTVGPFLTDLGAFFGLDIRATSALTAGLVMGIMIIPFVSSLSDDIITQVPRAMRDGSLALGGTKSETIIKIVVPAALPGIVGALLLAVSRAIGETMIVVLAAGNAPVLTANPFEAVSTVTVSIVNQLTGDQDFSSPQSLVAFALGLTLFAMTLVLNVIALVVVRRYREQYE